MKRAFTLIESVIIFSVLLISTGIVIPPSWAINYPPMVTNSPYSHGVAPDGDLGEDENICPQDCSGGQVCSNGSCVSPPAGSVAIGDPCTSSVDCALGICGGYPEVCREKGTKLHFESCTEHSECESSYCWADAGVCGSGEFGAQECSLGTECQGGFCIRIAGGQGRCNDGRPGPPPADCNNNSDCREGYWCQSNNGCTDGNPGRWCRPEEAANECLSGICENNVCL